MEAPPAADGTGSDGARRGRRALIVAGIVALCVVFVFWGKGRIAPMLSPTLEHRASLGGRNPQTCLGCHRPDGPARPRPSGHTPRQDCGGCHVVRPPA